MLLCTVSVSVTHIVPRSKFLVFRAVRSDLWWLTVHSYPHLCAWRKRFLKSWPSWMLYNTDRNKRKHIDAAGYTSMRYIFFAMSRAVFVNSGCCSLYMSGSVIWAYEGRKRKKINMFYKVNMFSISIWKKTASSHRIIAGFLINLAYPNMMRY